MMELITFEVTGAGDFPYDMLRYDRCFPMRETEDSYNMDVSTHKKYGEPRVIRLGMHGSGFRGPTVERWQSFGWHVVKGSVCWNGGKTEREKERRRMERRARSAIRHNSLWMHKKNSNLTVRIVNVQMAGETVWATDKVQYRNFSTDRLINSQLWSFFSNYEEVK